MAGRRAAAAALAAAAPAAGAPALGGYDAVAYWSLASGAEGVPGTTEHAFTLTTHDGVNASNHWDFEFLFSNAANRDSFAADPYKYLPQWGGFCSWGMSTELASNGWPWARDFLGPPGGPKDSWHIYDGKLYFTFMPMLIDQWLANASHYISVGNARWTEWFGALDKGPFNVDCTAATWWGHTCCMNPQVQAGIAPATPVSPECIAALDTVCKEYQQGVPDGPSQCIGCLTANMSAIVASGACPLVNKTDATPPPSRGVAFPPDASPLSPLVQHVYCF